MEEISSTTLDKDIQVTVAFLNCMKCKVRFSEKKEPLNLTCGHTVCRKCVNEIDDNSDPCLECRTRLFAKDVANLTINYPLLKFLRLINENPSILNVLTNQVSNLPRMTLKFCLPKEYLECPKHGSSAAVFCLSCRMWACQDCMVLDHRSPPRGTCRTASFVETLQKIKTEYERNINLSIKHLKVIQNNLAPEEARIAFLTEKLCSPEWEHNKFFGAIDTALSEIQKIDGTTINDAKTVLRKLLKSVRKTRSLVKMISFQEKLASQEKVLKDYIELEKERKLTLHQEIRQHLALDLKLLADGGTPLYAVQRLTDYSSSVTRWARIVSKDNHLLVTCLKEGKVPANGIIIPYNYVRELISKDSPTVFFEFGDADNKSSELIVVRLIDDVNTQVWYITFYCSGEGEKNFIGTSLFKTNQKKVVSGGDLEKNDGTGSNDCEDWFYYTHPIKWKSHSCMFSCVRFSTSKFAFLFDNKLSCIYLDIGWVISGVGFLRKLHNCESITGILVKDCGFVIPLGAEELVSEEENNIQDVYKQNAYELDGDDLHVLFS